MPDMQCTWWLDGIPTWLGGTGREWLHCCIQHDLQQVTDWGLAQCVAETGYPIMGVLMLAGLGAFGGVYRNLRRK